MNLAKTLIRGKPLKGSFIPFHSGLSEAQRKTATCGDTDNADTGMDVDADVDMGTEAEAECLTVETSGEFVRLVLAAWQAGIQAQTLSLRAGLADVLGMHWQRNLAVLAPQEIQVSGLKFEMV